MPTLSGVWVFNNELTLVPNYASSNAHIPISFTSNGLSFTSFNCGGNGTQQLSFWYHGSAPSEAYFYLKYQSYSTGWVADALRTVDFGTTEQEVSKEFHDWFTTNATQYINEEDVPTAKIVYGDIVRILTDSQTATLKCAGKMPTTDITIEFYQDGIITYNYEPTSLSAGDVATLVCANKQMATDVVVTTAQNYQISLDPAVISVDGDLLRITDNTGKAEEFSLLANGEEVFRVSSDVIEFTIRGYFKDEYTSDYGTKTFQARSGMTWREWCLSGYNTDGFMTTKSAVTRPIDIDGENNFGLGVYRQTPDDEITSKTYVYRSID